MTSRLTLRIRAAVALTAATAVTVAACGTRLDHNTIVAAAAGGGSGGGVSGNSGELGGPGGGVSGNSGELGGPGGSGPGVTGDVGAGGKPGTGPGSQGGDAGNAKARGGTGARADGGPGGGGGPIVIGTVGTYSGPAGAAYAPGARAIQVWAAATNAKGGINGRKVQVIVSDDGGDGAKARSQVQELVEDRKAVAIVGSMSTLTIAQWNSYVVEKKVPVVGGDCVHKLWNESPMLFNQCASQESWAYGMVATGAKLGRGKKWGALTCQEASACGYLEDLWFSKGYAKKAGLDPVYRARISIAQPDFTSECIQARNAGVQVLTVIADQNTLARVGASCKRQNFTPQFLQNSPTVGSATPKQPGLSDILVTALAFPFEGLSTPAASEFKAAWQKYAGGMKINGLASIGWASAKLFEKALRGAGGDFSRAGVLKGLYRIKQDRLGGLTVPLTYAAGKPTPDSPCWFVMKTANGRWTAPQGDRLHCR